MAKKIKKYSWIHELNEAAFESKLLSEAKIFGKSTFLTENAFEQSLQAAGGDLGIYRQIRASKDSKPKDIDGDGDADAEDIKLDASDNMLGNDDSPIDPSLMARYPSLQKGMKIGSREIKGDEAIKNMHAAMDAEIDRIVKTAPPGKRYTVQDLQAIGRLLSGK